MSAERIEFGYENDYGRKVVAENYLRLVNNPAIDISPTLLYGGWGVGKTKFCKKLMSLIEEENKMGCIYLDAFLTDHIDDPLLSVVAALYKDIPENEIFGKQIISGFKSFFNPNFLYNGISSAVYRVADSASKGAVDAVVQSYKKNASDSRQCEDPNFGLINLFKNYGDASNSMNLIRQGLEKRCENKPVLLIVDELDRCKPTYAIEMLEVIKHFLGIRNLHILLVANRDQLHASIENHYGDGINAIAYLEKFFHYSFELLMRENNENVIVLNDEEVIKEYARALLKEAKMPINVFEINSKWYDKSVLICLRKLSPTFRTINTVIKHLTVYYHLDEGREYNVNIFSNTEVVYPQSIRVIITLAVIAFCFYPDIRKMAMENNLSIDELSEKMFKVNDLDNICTSGDVDRKTYWILVLLKLNKDVGSLDNWTISELSEKGVISDKWSDIILDRNIYHPTLNVYELFISVIETLSLNKPLLKKSISN